MTSYQMGLGEKTASVVSFPIWGLPRTAIVWHSGESPGSSPRWSVISNVQPRRSRDGSQSSKARWIKNSTIKFLTAWELEMYSSCHFLIRAAIPGMWWKRDYCATSRIGETPAKYVNVLSAHLCHRHQGFISKNCQDGTKVACWTFDTG